jgi:hypothetical protein
MLSTNCKRHYQIKTKQEVYLLSVMVNYRRLTIITHTQVEGVC